MTHWTSNLRRRLPKPAFFRTRLTRSVLALGVTQIICWGSTYYALGVLADPIINGTGWSRSIVFGGLTVALLASAAVSTWIGRLIDRHGARLVMSFGTVLMVIGLIWLANVHSALSYLSAWTLLGAAMRMTLYDAAFAALVQIAPAHGRRAISYLTLFGGFASTIFWPIGHALNAATDWRTTFLIFAGLILVICLPLHWFGLAPPTSASSSAHAKTADGDPVCDADIRDAAGLDAPSAQNSKHDDASEGTLPPSRRRRAMIAFAIVLLACGFIFGTFAVHMVNLISAGGLTLASAVFIASFKGAAQVAGRIGDIVFARNIAPVALGRFSLFLLFIGLTMLLIATARGDATFTAALTFTLVLGIGQGIFTIVRGTVPLVLFGAKGYGEILGRLAVPMTISSAIAPAIFAAIVDGWGYQVGEFVLLACALLALVAMQMLLSWTADGARPDRTAPPGQ